MKKLFNKGIKGIFAVGAVVILAIAVSWLMFCGIFKLITLCFGLPFSWSIATGVWLTVWFVRIIFFKETKK